MPEDIANNREGNAYSDQPRQVPEPEPAPPPTQPGENAAPMAVPGPPQMPAPPQMAAAERVRLAAQRRDRTHYIFNYWTALGVSILTPGIYGHYALFQLLPPQPEH